MATNLILKKKRKKYSSNSYSTYIYKILKRQQPDVSISKKSMIIMDSFVIDVLDRIATESGRLARYNKKRTISSKEIQTSVRLVISGELAKHSVSKGTKAVIKYNENRLKVKLK